MTELQADLGIDRGAFRLDARFAARAGETVALVGPNGAGKTTCLHALAGLLRLHRGRLAIGDEVLDDATPAGFVPAESRRVGVVFQDHLLFPHLSVLDNVAFGLRARGARRRVARDAARGWLERVGLAALASRRPRELSGGQAQRVALARALAAQPRILLLDEPLAAVDATARLALRRELSDHLAGFDGVRLLVVHDVHDALALADRLVVLEAGRVIQSGTRDDVLRRPASTYVADLVGLNRLVGVAEGEVVTVDGAELVVAGAIDGPVLVTIHPRAVALFGERPSGSPRNVWRAPVLAVEPALDRLRVSTGGPLGIVAEVTRAAVTELGLRPGAEIWVAVKATEIGVTPC